MLGTVRLVLAILVVANHFWLPVASTVGAHAVTAFYMVSGYLMTAIINGAYKGRRWAYAENRFLRLAPAYWLFLVAMVIGLLVAPEPFRRTYSLMVLPDNALDWLRNLTLIDLPAANVLLVPPAWSLTIEAVFYILIGLGLASRPSTVVAWWVASVAVTIWLIWSGASFGERYSPTYAASLFFSTGSMLWWFRSRLGWITMPPGALLVALGFFAVSPLLVRAADLDPFMIGYYGPALLFVPIFVAALAAKTGRYAPIDRRLGDLAYPVFVSHYFAAGLVNCVVLDTRLPMLGWLYCSLVVVVTLILSWLYIVLVDVRVQRIRAGIRSRAHRTELFVFGSDTAPRPHAGT